MEKGEMKKNKNKNKIFKNFLKQKEYEKNVIYDAKKLKECEMFKQYCKSCKNKNNKIICYSNLLPGKGVDEIKPHRADLCAKCLSGDHCFQYTNL